jgi:hypothetical protein
MTALSLSLHTQMQHGISASPEVQGQEGGDSQKDGHQRRHAVVADVVEAVAAAAAGFRAAY